MVPPHAQESELGAGFKQLMTPGHWLIVLPIAPRRLTQVASARHCDGKSRRDGERE